MLVFVVRECLFIYFVIVISDHPWYHKYHYLDEIQPELSSYSSLKYSIVLKESANCEKLMNKRGYAPLKIK